MKIKNKAPRIISFGRILVLQPDDKAVEINDTQFEQLRRDPTIRALIDSDTIAVSPADLFDLDEDPHSLPPVAMPPRRAGGFTDSKNAAQATQNARKRSRAAEREDFSGEADMRTSATIAAAEKKAAAQVAVKQPVAPSTYTAENVDTLPEDEVLEFVHSSKDVTLLSEMWKTVKNPTIKAALGKRGAELTQPKPPAAKA